MLQNRFPALLLCGLLICLLASPAHATTSLYQTVEQALNYSPRLRVLEHNLDAVKSELLQSRGEYLPSVDMILGYGTDQHSDRSTRSVGADPSENDWDARGEASLSLTQKLYDGGEVKSRVAVRQALVDSVDFRVYDNAQAIALDAIIAHLNVYRQRELVALSEKNVKMHNDILASLDQLQAAGAGSIADVTQVQGRLARAKSTLAIAKADLAAAEANYLRLVGAQPQKVGFAGVPETLAGNLQQALTETEKGNPKVLALDADVEEAKARVDLAKSTYMPKLNLELSSNYRDQLEGDPSWQQSNEAMLRMRWNLFNGGQDKYGIDAAAARKMQARSNRNEQLVEVLEETTATWAQYQSAQQQKQAYRDAVVFNEQTLDSYLKQFNVSQRSLLDVLDAENEYFQSGGQLLTTSTNETIAAYRLLALAGQLRVARTAGEAGEEPEFLKALRSEIAGLQKTPQLRVVPQVAEPVVKGEITLSKPVIQLPEASIQQFLESWRQAWESQAIETYLDFYSSDYVPERGRDLVAWEQFRRRRLSQPERIQLSIEAVEIEPMGGGNYRVKFTQNYASNLYHDRVQKVLELKPREESWQILRELAKPPNS